MKGGSHGLQGNRGGGETVIANRVQRGGAYKTLTANEGIIKILQRFGGGGGHKVNFSVIQQKSSYPSLGNIYIVTGPKHGKACMDGGTQKNK